MTLSSNLRRSVQQIIDDKIRENQEALDAIRKQTRKTWRLNFLAMILAGISGGFIAHFIYYYFTR